MLLIIILTSCNATRYLPDDQSLVKKVKLVGVDKQFSETALTFVQSDIRPNSRLNLALYNMFNTKNGKYRTDKVKVIGEAPHILDSSLVEISRTQIEKFLTTKGYFKAEVKSDMKVEKKQAVITFTAVQGPEFTVRNISSHPRLQRDGDQGHYARREDVLSDGAGRCGEAIQRARREDRPGQGARARARHPGSRAGDPFRRP